MANNSRMRKIYKFNLNYDNINIRPIDDSYGNVIADVPAPSPNANMKMTYLSYIFDRRKWKCEKCKSIFSSVRDLKSHKKDMHAY